jgi:hypothetical protein
MSSVTLQTEYLEYSGRPGAPKASRGLQLSGHADRQSILGEVMEDSDRAVRVRKGAGGKVPKGLG